MSTSDIAVAVFLGAMVLFTAMGCWALLVFNNVYVRLHYLSVVTTVGMFPLLVAVAIKEGWGVATAKTILVFLLLLTVNAVLSHATARAARVRQFGHWTPQADEPIERPGGDQ